MSPRDGSESKGYESDSFMTQSNESRCLCYNFVRPYLFLPLDLGSRLIVTEPIDGVAFFGEVGVRIPERAGLGRATSYICMKKMRHQQCPRCNL